jgi:2-dehydro-3-deoxygalactonokinase
MRFVAVDWGTTNRRAYVIDNGAVIATERDDHGINALAARGFEAEIDALQARFEGLPMLLAGMIGSDRGWINAGYVAAPADLDAMAAGVVRARADVGVVPGVSRIVDGRGDVMRGEEVQLLGAVAVGLAPGDALLCQPGTHCKWARMVGGRVQDFTTAMTGEMFSLLRDHALIGREMITEPADDAAFLDGVAESARSDLLGSLFGVRPASLLSLRAPTDAGSFVSGLLIGADCRAHVGTGEAVHLLADGRIGALYARALDAIGPPAHRIDSHVAFVAGITRIQERLS